MLSSAPVTYLYGYNVKNLAVELAFYIMILFSILNLYLSTLFKVRQTFGMIAIFAIYKWKCKMYFRILKFAYSCKFNTSDIRIFFFFLFLFFFFTSILIWGYFVNDRKWTLFLLKDTLSVFTKTSKSFP